VVGKYKAVSSKPGKEEREEGRERGAGRGRDNNKDKKILFKNASLG
jgi:hypothetical protein